MQRRLTKINGYNAELYGPPELLGHVVRTLGVLQGQHKLVLQTLSMRQKRSEARQPYQANYDNSDSLALFQKSLKTVNYIE